MRAGASKNRDRGAAPNNRGAVKPTEVVSAYLTAEDAERVRQAAERERLSLSAYARRALVQAAARDVV